MTRRLLHALLMISTFSLFAPIAEQARAGVLLTLDNPNPIVAVPASGSIIYAFTGTLSFDPGYSANGDGLSFPFMGGNPIPLIGSLQNYPYAAANNGGTFVGTLFTFQINSTSALGLYDHDVGGGLAAFSIGEVNAARDTQSSTINYTITLVAASVAEPASFVLASIAGLVALAGISCRRVARAR